MNGPIPWEQFMAAFEDPEDPDCVCWLYRHDRMCVHCKEKEENMYGKPELRTAAFLELKRHLPDKLAGEVTGMRVRHGVGHAAVAEFFAGRHRVSVPLEYSRLPLEGSHSEVLVAKAMKELKQKIEAQA